MRKVITIAREFGAGGGEIGRRVAKELGIQFYDKDIILRTALANPKLDPEDVRRWDERVPSSFGFAQSLFDFYNKPLDERLWQAQRDAIREMANHESCVIVGRNSIRPCRIPVESEENVRYDAGSVTGSGGI